MGQNFRKCLWRCVPGNGGLGWGWAMQALLPLSQCSLCPQLLTSVLPAGDSWGILAFLCATLWNLPVVPALNSTDQVTTRQSIQQTYDLTRYLEHQLHTLAATYVSAEALRELETTELSNLVEPPFPPFFAHSTLL